MSDRKGHGCCQPAEGNLPVLNRGCCGGKDFGPVRQDECAQGSDVAAFSKRVMVACPKCKAKVCDEDEWCGACGARVEAAGKEAKGVPLGAAIVVMVGVGAAVVLLSLV